jgi:hypothetical protein
MGWVRITGVMGLRLMLVMPGCKTISTKTNIELTRYALDNELIYAVFAAVKLIHFSISIY